MQIKPQLPGVERSYNSAPTLDTERQTPFATGHNWNPDHIEIFGHKVDIDIPTGNIIISTNDIAYPYYTFSLGISRKYDAQEQQMQLLYLRDYPNVSPKPHWFGNWQFAYEADVDEVWLNAHSELHVTSGIGANGLFEIKNPEFRRNLNDGILAEKVLRTYGISGRTLNELRWKFTNNDLLLRTFRGPFQILSGHFFEETVVDDINAEIWFFNPISGSAFHITSEFFYNIQGNKYRDIGYPLIVTKLVDALGHAVDLKPSDISPPFRKYILSDGSGRELHIGLDEQLTFLDGLNLRGEVRKYIVTKVKDCTKTNHNVFDYGYNAEHFLEKINYPSSIGNRFIKYYYEDPKHSGILTAIENGYGHKIQFEYVEDPTDNDERLNPRLKIKKITDPEKICFEYEYNHIHSKVTVVTSKNGNIDRKNEYEYIRDIHNTKQRFIASTKIKVRKGYVVDFAGNITARQSNNPQDIQNRTKYSEDGRFNVEKEIDPLNRIIRYQYNDFNQINKIWDFDNHWTKYTYDIHDNPSPANPRCYDTLSVDQENILHVIDPSNLRNIIERITVIKKEFKYDKYDSENSHDNTDYNCQSTHRVSEETDERGKVWTYSYDDLNSNSPLVPTLIKSPLGTETKSTYNNRGERLSIIDSEGNICRYEYYDQGMLKKYIDPNKEEIIFEYYPCGNWPYKFKDQLGNVTEFIREFNGQIRTIMDPVQDATDYEYQKNGRLHKIINHRPAVPPDPTNPRSLITGFPNLETEFRYTPLGMLNSLKNPKGLELLFEYDEAGRMFNWHHDVPNSKFTKFIYDVASQLLRIIDRKSKSIIYTYYNSGTVKTIQYPNWYDGANDIPGKQIKYKYDYLGRVLSIEDSEIPGVKECIYDEAGNIVLRRDPDGFELNLTYDNDNRLWHVKDSNSVYELTLNLDNLGRPRSLQDSAVLDGSLLWEYKYRKQVGSITKVLNLFERSLPQIGLISRFDYDKRNLLELIEHEWAGSPPKPIYAQHFHYRDDDLLDHITGNDSNSFKYDGNKQLIYESVGNLYSDYDEAGNRLYQADKTTNPNPIVNIYSENNQLKEERGVPADFTYDENGNILTSTYPFNPTEYYFDGMNCLRFIKNSQYKISYLYDGYKNLVQRVVKSVNGGTIEKTKFYYLLSKPIFVQRDGNPYRLITWDPVGKILRIRLWQNVGGATCLNSLFPLYQGVGDIVRFVNSDQEECVKISYDSWGNILNLVDSDNLFEYWGYRGGLLDRLVGNLLFGARWYLSKIGRWISEDPIASEKLDIESTDNNILELNNLYCYAINDPVNKLDPSGFQAVLGGSFMVFGRPWFFFRPNPRLPVGGRYTVRYGPRTPPRFLRPAESTGTPRGGMRVGRGFGRVKGQQPVGEELVRPTGKEAWWESFMKNLGKLLGRGDLVEGPANQSPMEIIVEPSSSEEYYIEKDLIT